MADDLSGNTQLIALTQNQNGTSSDSKLQYPISGHGEEGGQWVTFTVYKYTRPTLKEDYKPEPTGDTLKLPLPLTLSTNYTLGWDNVSLGAFGTQVGETASKVAGEFKGMQFSSFMDAMDKIGGDSGKLGKAIASDIITDRDTVRKLGAAAGYARNPFVAATFEGVAFRTFPFQYKLTPKSFKESQAIEKIITLLKKVAHPSYSSLAGITNSLFTYPNMILPKFSHPDYLFDIGMCVIRDITVDYHAENGPIYYDQDDKKMPAFINLSFQLNEIEIITRETLGSYSFTNSKDEKITGRGK